MNKTKFSSAENIFLIICLFVGLVFISITPIWQIPDEEAHFLKMYSITDGHFNFEKCKLDDGKTYSCTNVPLSILSIRENSEKISLLFFDRQKIKPLEKNKKDYLIYMVPSYSLFSYMPTILVLQVLKTLNIPPVYIIYILRFIFLFTYCTIVYFAIKITPVKKHLFTLCGLVPTAIYSASGISADGLIISLCFLYIAYIFNLAFNKHIKNLSKLNIFSLFLLLLYITVCKFPYGFLAFLICIIPQQKFKFYSKPKTIITILTFIIMYVIWHILHHIYMTKGISSSVPWFVSPIETLQYSIQNPLFFIDSLIKSIKINSLDWYGGTVARYGWENIYIPISIIAPYGITLALSGFFQDKDEIESDISTFKNKMIYLFIGILFFITTYTICYLLFSNASHQTVIKFQGRYFIPILPLIYLLLSTRIPVKYNGLKIISLLSYLFLIFISIIILISKFYINT
ncbi:DUF2142 domain-containing protein [bacterium]|nr:DUF2142 domain-containing protein [bacterium]